MENRNRSGVLRMVIKDLGSASTKEDMMNQQVTAVIERSDRLADLIKDPKGLDLKIRENIGIMRADINFDNEYKQVASQSSNPREVIYLKFLNLNPEAKYDVAIFNGEKLVVTFSLNDVKRQQELKVTDKKLILKYQSNLDILVISSESFNRQEGKEGKFRDKIGGANEEGMMEDEEDNEKEKRKIELRKNVFNQKITEKDKINFQLYNQDNYVNCLINLTLSSSGNGRAVMEAVIKQSNGQYLRGDRFEKDEGSKRYIIQKLDDFQRACRQFLPYKDIETELVDRAENEDQEQALNPQQEAARLGLFSFNEYQVDEIKFFMDEFKARYPYVLPHEDLNHKIFIALQPNWVHSLFVFQPKKGFISQRFNQPEILASLHNFIDFMVNKPEILLKYLCMCFNYYSQAVHYFGTISLQKSLNFILNLIKRNFAEFSVILSNNDRLREMYFTTVGRMVFSFYSVPVEIEMKEEDEFYLKTIESEREREDFSEYITRLLLVDTLISDIPELQVEFFRSLFNKKEYLPYLTSNYFVFYFNHDKIPTKEKIDILKNLFSLEKPALTKELANFVSRVIMAPQILNLLSFEEFFGTIDQLYASNCPHNFMTFMRNTDLCILHQRVISAFGVTKAQGALNYISTHKERYFPSLHDEIVKFLESLERDILIEFIGVPNILSDKKIELFDTVMMGKTVKDPRESIVRLHLKHHIQSLNTIKANIDTFNEVLKRNEMYFNEYKFYIVHRDGIKNMQNEILEYTVNRLLNEEIYTKSLALLNIKQWNSYNQCQNYRLFYESLKSKCSNDISLPQYYQKAVETMNQFRELFTKFADPLKFSNAEYDKYLPRVTFSDLFELYQKTFTSLDIPKATQDIIFEHCKILHSLNKVMKIQEPMAILSAANYLNLKKDKFTDNVNYLADQFKGKSKDSISVADVIKVDSKTKILKVKDYESSPTYKMPMVLKDLANSYECYKFVKETADEFIKSMREEVDNENLDVVNKLDIINKNLKFLMYEKSFEEVVKKFMMIHKDDQRKIKKYLRDLNGQIQSHIVHLVEKTKKDQNYNQKIMQQLLVNSVVKVKYAKLDKKFEIWAEYEERGSKYVVKTVEFEEFLNKAKIIAENSNTQDAFGDLMREFRDFGAEIENICDKFLSLRQLGLIYNSCDLLIPLMNTACQKLGYFNLDNNNTVLQFNYKSGSKDLHLLRKASHELSDLEKTLSKELLNYYSAECYLMTYFFGKKLFFLTKLLRGKATPEEEKETISLITESIPANLIDFGKRVPIPDNIYKVFNATYLTLKEWSSNIKSRDKIKINNSSVFTSKKIKTCNSNLNVYRTICKILYEANESMVSLSQILFCTKSTSKNEIISFCKRCMLDPFKRLYFILSIDRMDYLMVMEMKNSLLKIIDSKYDNLNYNLLIFNPSGSQSKNMFDNENFENINHSLSQLDSMIKDEDFQNTYANLFKTNVIVMSETAGMGKTKWIEKDLSNKYPKYDVFFSGEMNRETVKRRLNHLTESSRGISHFVITIKLDFMEDFDYHCEMIDYLLFCLSIVRRYYTDLGCNDMRDQTVKVYYEVSNTFIGEALTRLKFLEILNSSEGQNTQAGSSFKFRVVMPKFAFENVNFSNDPNSIEQVVAKFLKAVDDKKINSKSIEELPLVSQKEYVELLKKYYMLDVFKPEKTEAQRSQTTFAQYQFWLQSMNKMIREMEVVSEFAAAKGDPSGSTTLRYELAVEIIQFCSYIINVSVDQAKMSQDQMKEIMTEIKKQNIRKQNLEIYQQKFSKITPWDASQLIVPLMNSGSVLFSLIDLEDIFNFNPNDPQDPKKAAAGEAKRTNPRFRARTNLRNHIKTSKKMIELNPEIKNYSDRCLTLLADFLKQDPKDVIQRAKEFKGKGFVITLDNYMKIALIILKSYLKIPIVMMGESGCGKTYLSEFVSECLLQDKMKELTLYAGVTELDFIKFMKTAIVEANELAQQGKNLWIFFDEFNTSSLQSIVAEIMIDRVCSIEPSIYNIPSNIIFISCCNPFRMKTKKTEVGLVPKTSDTILSHRVYPIPERLLNYVWDFGQLSEADEKKHIISMVAAEKFFDPKQQKQREERFVNFLYIAHKTVRNIEERSGVSLRDIKRVLALYRWFRDTISYLIQDVGHKKFKVNEIHLRATLCAITVAYGLRLNGRNTEQGKLFKEVASIAKTEITMGTVNINFVKDTLPHLSDVFLGVLQKQTLRVIPEGVALNRPLKENFITMLACYDAKIPLIICGAPGTSKTLCSQIFDTAMVPIIIKNNKEFVKYKSINSIYYGGSQTSTSEGIAKVFHRADQYLKTKGEDRPVVVFDEIGLAELSPYNPLKILHPLLEKPDQEIGFFGLSNWTLDLSKMNRLIYLARPDMTKDDLIEIFNISTSGCKNDKAKNDLKNYLSLLADTYLEFRQWQKTHGTHPNFHGSRDIYGVSKYVFNIISTIKNYNSDTLKNLVKDSIERNFNGAAYLFGDGSNELNFDTVPGLNGHASSKSLNNVRIEDIGTPYGQANHGDLQVLNIYSSAQVFKQLFLNKIASKPEIADVFKTGFFEDAGVFNLIKDNIYDTNSRFLLIKSEGEVVDNIFMEGLSKLVNTEKLKDWRGIKGKEKSLELLSNLKTYISLGYIVVMKNLDELYGSLYDLFNQKYLEIEGRKYCYLYFGENKHKVEVHPEFKAVILLDAENELQGLELELEQPAPFLNRFEKFFVRLANILAYADIKTVYDMVCNLQNKLNGDMFKILGLSIDMLTSIVIRAHRDGNNLEETSQRLLHRLSTSNLLLSDGLSQQELQVFQEEHPYKNIWGLMEDMKVKPAVRMCLFTFSNPIELEHIKSQISEISGSKVISSEELMLQGLEARAERIKRYDHAYFIVQFNSLEHLSLITQLKTSINENQKIKKTLFIIHLDRRAKDITAITKNIGINYWNEWDNCVIEDINHCNYSELKEIYDYSLVELLFNDRYTIGSDLIKEAALSALQRVIIEKNDDGLKSCFQAIREMVQNDPDNIFANILIEKIKQSKLINCDNKWRTMVVEKRLDTRTYVDLRSELLQVLIANFGDIFKKYMIKLNEELTNIGSYARYIFNSNEKISSLFKEKLKDTMNACALNRMAIHTVRYTQTFYKLPFLNKLYESFRSNYDQKILVENKDTYANLAETQNRFIEYSHSKKPNNEIINQLRDNLQNGEEFIYSLVVSVLAPLLDEVRSKYPLVFQEPILLDNFIFDIIFIMIKKWEEKTERQGQGAGKAGNEKYKMLNLIQHKYHFFKLLCSAMSGHSDTDKDFSNTVTASSIISVCFQADMKYIFNLIDVSNIEIKEFEKTVKDADFEDTDKIFRFKYSLFSKIIKNMQSKLIPDFKDDQINLKFLKNRYSDMISESLKNVAKGTKNYDLKYVVILLDILDILPFDESNKYITEISQIKREQDRLGGAFDISFIKNYITKILKVIHLVNGIDRERLTLVVSEYCNTNAQSFNFSLFIGIDYDPLFSIFSQLQQEKIASSLGHDISNNIDPFWTLEQLKRTLSNIDYSRSLLNYDLFLTNLDCSKKRSYYLIISMIDKLVFNGITHFKQLSDKEIMDIYTFLYNTSKFESAHTGLENIIRYSMIRLCLLPEYMEQLRTDQSLIKRMDSLIIEQSKSKEYFIDNPNSFPLIYFLQQMIVESGDMSRFQMQYRAITNICGLVMDEDTGGSIIFFNPEVQKYYIDVNNKLSDYAYNNQLDKMTQLIQSSYKGSKKFNNYVVGVVLLNKFINPVSKEDANVIQNIKNLFIKALNQVDMVSEIYRRLLIAIIDGSKFNFKEFLGDSSNDPNYETRLKKVFYQFLLLAMCFEKEVGYDLHFWKKWAKRDFRNDGFKCRIVSNNSINNTGSIFENIVVERLSDGSYMDYGPQYLANLGIYKCSCNYFYSIGNCGYAMVTRPCPVCGKEIGGSNHNFIQRKGHEHIKSLEDFDSRIQEIYKQDLGKYMPHTVLTRSSLEITPIKLKEMGIKGFVQAMKKPEMRYQLDNFMNRLQIRHLFDHLLIIALPEILPEAESKEFVDSLKGLLPYKNREFKELYGRMAGREIKDYKEYFLAHVKNDLEQLSSNFKFKNPVLIFDFMRAALSNMAENLLNDHKMSETNLLIEEKYLTDPQSLLPLQQEIADRIRDNELDLKSVFKAILFRNVRLGLMPGLFQKYGKKFEDIYTFMRHNDLEVEHIKKEFSAEIQKNSKNGFLRSVFNYQSILKDFPVIVDANVKVAYHFNLNYDRAFNFDETTNTDIMKLDDGNLKKLYQEYERVWQTIIPLHEDKNPEVFSFAFMCQQNLNVKNFIDGVLAPGGAKMIKFLFIDPKEYNDVNLLYMNSIVRTFIEKFHNSLVEKLNKVLNLDTTDEKNTSRKNIEYCTQDDYISYSDITDHILNNFWYETTINGENSIHFDMDRIEYLVAQDMKKPLINFDEKDIRFYNFKNTKLSEYEANLQELIKKVKAVPLGDEIVKMYEEMSEANIAKSFEFILEVGNYILKNFMFNNEQVHLKRIVQNKSEHSLLQRFNSYDESIHSKLILGHLGPMYTLLKDLKFDWEITHNRANYNRDLSKDEQRHFMELLEDPNITDADLEAIKEELRSVVLANYVQGENFTKQPLQYFGFYINEYSPSAENLDNLMADQYFKIIDFLNQGIIIKSKKSFVKKRSSIMSDS